MSTPTPRADAEFEKWIESTQPFTDALEFARTLERELASLTAEVTQARKEWIGNAHAHLPLGEAIGAVRKADSDRHAELLEVHAKLLAKLDEAREELSQRVSQLRNTLIERDRYKVDAERKRMLAREFESVLGFTEEEARKEGAIEEAVRRIRVMKKALCFAVPDCDRLHHPKRYQHPETHPCPCVDIVREAKKIAR